MSSADVYSIVVTFAIAAGLAILASISAHYVGLSAGSTWVLWLAVAVGGLGGLAHEIAQSGGKILFFKKETDGMYLGSLAGVVLGAVAGLLAVRGLIVNPAVQPGAIQLVYESFLAGLALKGITEAAAGQVVPPATVPGQPSPPR
jgi:hypothetical protein